MTVTGLVLMDYQQAICREDGAVGRSGLGRQVAERGVLQAAAAVLQHFREHDLPRVHVRVAFDPAFHSMTSASPRFQSFRERGLMIDGTPEAAICEEVAPRADEPVITKGCVIPFVGTNLPQVLNARGITHLVLGGVATNQVVEGTARVAADSGYRVTVLEDLCAGASEELHAFSVNHMLPNFGQVTDSGEFLGRASP